MGGSRNPLAEGTIELTGRSDRLRPLCRLTFNGHAGANVLPGSSASRSPLLWTHPRCRGSLCVSHLGRTNNVVLVPRTSATLLRFACPLLGVITARSSLVSI